MLMQILIGLVAFLGTIIIAMLWYYVKRRDKQMDALIKEQRETREEMIKSNDWLQSHERRLNALDKKP